MHASVTRKLGSLIVALLLCLSVTPALAARRPTTTQAAQVVERFFARYAKKYPTSLIGTHPATSATVHDLSEIRKHYILASVTLHLTDRVAQPIYCTLAKRSLGGWTVAAWESIDAIPAPPSEGAKHGRTSR